MRKGKRLRVTTPLSRKARGSRPHIRHPTPHAAAGCSGSRRIGRALHSHHTATCPQHPQRPKRPQLPRSSHTPPHAACNTARELGSQNRTPRHASCRARLIPLSSSHTANSAPRIPAGYSALGWSLKQTPHRALDQQGRGTDVPTALPWQVQAKPQQSSDRARQTGGREG